MAMYPPDEGGLVLRLLKEHLATKLKAALAAEAERVLSEVVDEALASLQGGVQHYRDHYGMKDIFSVEVKVKSHVEKKP